MRQININKTRKEHKCSFCDRTIPKGTACIIMKEKEAVYNYEEGHLERQIGVRFNTYRQCKNPDC
jgi:ribosomal protein L24E